MSIGIIYKIYSTHDDDFYIGCTFKSVEKRFTGHKRKSRNPLLQNIKLYKKSKEIGWSNMLIQEIEKLLCSRLELRKLEGEYIRKLCPTLNTNKTGLYFEEDGTYNKKKYLKDYREKNGDDLRDSYRVYCVKNREKLLEKKKEYYYSNRETRLTTQREYYQNNREKILAHSKEYNQTNREIITARKKNTTTKTKTNIK